MLPQHVGNGGGRKMDKFMDNRWVMKIIALLMAFMLYMSINIDTNPSQPFDNTFTVSSRDTETVTDVAVNAYFDRENLVVSGVPQNVTVTLEGPTSIVKPAAMQRDLEVFVNLVDLDLGTHQVPLQHRNLSEKLTVKIEPSYATITIHEKVTRDFPVEVDFINLHQIEEGYQAEQPIVKPNIVKVTGSSELINRIALVKARVDLKDANESMEQQSRVVVYDREGNTLNVEVEPAVVDVSVPITSPNKSVPLRINRKGTLKQNLSITRIEPVPTEVTIYGPKNVIDNIEFIDNIDIDLTEIDDTTEIEIETPIPDGVRRVVPEKITIRVEVEKETQKTFLGKSINYIGLSSGLVLEFVNPDNGSVDLTVLGAPSVLEDVSSEDMELYINVTDLGVGEHDVPLEVNGPQNISWELPRRNVRISITEN